MPMPPVLPVLTADEVDEQISTWTKKKSEEYPYSNAFVKARNNYYIVGLDRYLIGGINSSRIARCFVLNNDCNSETSRGQLYRLGKVIQDANETSFQKVDAKKVLKEVLDGLKEWDVKGEILRNRHREKSLAASKTKPQGGNKKSTIRPITGTRASASSTAASSSSIASITRQENHNPAMVSSNPFFASPPKQPKMSVDDALKAGFTGFDIEESPSTSTSGAMTKQPTKFPVKVMPNPLRKRRFQ